MCKIIKYKTNDVIVFYIGKKGYEILVKCFNKRFLIRDSFFGLSKAIELAKEKQWEIDHEYT